MIFDKGFSVLTFAEQMTNLSSGNINFETLPTTGPEPSTNKDALATDPAQVRAFFQAISDGSAGDNGGTAGARRPRSQVDPASVTVDVQDGTIADGVTAYAAHTVDRRRASRSARWVWCPAPGPGYETDVTEIHLRRRRCRRGRAGRARPSVSASWWRTTPSRPATSW